MIGRYWAAHHEFVGCCAASIRPDRELNLVYLAFIAFLPFPTALLGNSSTTRSRSALYAVMVAIISGLEVVLFRGAQRHGLMRQKIPEDVYRWGVIQSLSPVVFFLISVPVAFVSTTLAVVLWFGGIPFAAVSNRWKPEDAERYLAH